jgi:hypothetical protein
MVVLAADPLRVLRAVRFGTRFGFELETSILEAAASDQVCQGLFRHNWPSMISRWLLSQDPKLNCSSAAIYQITRLPTGPIIVGRPRGANLGSMGNNRRNTVIMSGRL